MTASLDATRTIRLSIWVEIQATKPARSRPLRKNIASALAIVLPAHKLYNDFTLGTTLAERATRWIDEQTDKPFFLYFSTTNIHHPFTPAPRFQGTTSTQLVSGVDMLATFAALTQQTLDHEQLADSVNVLPALIDEPESPLRDTLVLCPHKPTHLAVLKGK